MKAQVNFLPQISLEMQVNEKENTNQILYKTLQFVKQFVIHPLRLTACQRGSHCFCSHLADESLRLREVKKVARVHTTRRRWT